jgi:acetoin utilization protein AcuB
MSRTTNGPTPIRDIMRADVVTVAPSDNVAVALARMAKHHVHSLPVTEEDERGELVLGIVTDRDIRLAANSPYLWGTSSEIVEELAGLRVTDVMSEAVVSVYPGTPVAEAARELLEREIGGLPVVELENGENYLVGVVTRTDLLRHLIALEDGR